MKKLLSGFYPFYYIKFSISLPLLVFEPVAFAPVGYVVHKYRAQSGRIKTASSDPTEFMFGFNDFVGNTSASWERSISLELLPLLQFLLIDLPWLIY